MKKLLVMIMLLTFCFALAACGKAADKSGEGATGAYKDENMNEVTLYQNDDESYHMVISFYRLTEIEGDATVDGDAFILNSTDAAGKPITLSFYPDTDSYTLEVKESEWDLLPAGEVFHDFMPVLNGDS